MRIYRNNQRFLRVNFFATCGSLLLFRSTRFRFRWLRRTSSRGRLISSYFKNIKIDSSPVTECGINFSANEWSCLSRFLFRGSSVVLCWLAVWPRWQQLRWGVKTVKIFEGQKLGVYFFRVFPSFKWINLNLDLSDLNEIGQNVLQFLFFLYTLPLKQLSLT